jgi:hypothetical protein
MHINDKLKLMHRVANKLILLVLLFLDRFSGNTDEIDTITIASSVWQIVTKMSTIDTNGFASFHTSDIVPVHLLIAKAGPAVSLAFLDKLIKSTTLGGCKE